MKTQSKRYAKYMKFALYVVVIVLVNLAGQTLFQRFDLTDNKVFSLSEVSKKVVATLSEPLTIKVFFTQQLPPPHNNTELYLRDLLNEYALHSNKYFNYTFYNVSPQTEGISAEATTNREMARTYGINPVQIQLIEKDEVKFQQAYMGLVLIHGDIIERIPTITTTDGLEYKLTTAIQKLNNKVSALLSLEENVQVKLVLSSSIYKVAPYMGLKELNQYPDKIKKIVEQLNAKTYGKLAYTYIDPSSDPGVAAELKKYDLMDLNWPAIPEANVAPGEGTIGLVVQYKNDARDIPLLHVLRIPLLGTQYQLTEPSEVEELINVNLERLVNINEDLGYLADHGTLNLQGFGPMAPQDENTLNSFNALAGKTYSIKSIAIDDTPIPDGLKCLVIARPTEPFSDYALYQIDQALMRGTNLAIFMDAFKETQPPGQQPFMANQGPMFLPLDTGLEKLLDHYGVRIKKSMVMDENCYRQRLPQERGGGEQALYFVPIIQSEQINTDLDYIKNIKGLITLKISPLELDQKQIEAQKITAYKLFSSSKRSWEMRDRIMLNPMFIQPPASDKEMTSLPLAYLLEGKFDSYFKGKPMPEKPAPKKETEQGADTNNEEGAEKSEAPAEAPKVDLSAIAETGAFREQSPAAKILLVGSSEMLKDNLLDEEGRSTNSMFVLNMLDALNDHEDMAVMRSKQQVFNPLQETTPGTKVFIKAFNIVGLPILVVLFGGIVWLRRHSRKKRLQLMFQQ
jgi:ABC-2 type transport system permease protein